VHRKKRTGRFIVLAKACFCALSNTWLPAMTLIVGGADEGNTSVYRWNLVLPNSRMTITIPLLQFRMASIAPSGRVLPDCPVPLGRSRLRTHAQPASTSHLA
jgi:hypothetical protein